MTFAELARIVGRAFDAGARRLRIQPADFGAAATDLRDLFALMPGTRALNLDQVRGVETHGQSLTAAGLLAGAPGLTSQTVPATAVFQLSPAGQPELTLGIGTAKAARGATAPTWASYFPKLAHTIFDSVSLSQQLQSMFIY